MRRWKERVKTVLLYLLVLTSFFLTAMLWNNQPPFQPIEPAKYVKSKPVQTKQLEELVTPESVIFHYGEERHTRAFSTDAHYRLIKEEMAKWIFFEFYYYPLSEEKWEELTRDNLGLEIQFRSTVPMSILNQLFTFRDEKYEQLKGIDRLWLYYEEKEDLVYALFISTEDELVMRARTAISPKDLRESYLRAANLLPEQILKVVKNRQTHPTVGQDNPFWHVYYLPKDRLKMQQFLYNYLPITDEELIEAYFLDRTLVRQIVERDNTTIFTDGSRSIQKRPDHQVITYTDPAFHQGNMDISEEEKLKGAVSFINKHLGWTDDYHFETIRKSYNDKDLITFRQYIGAYPLVSTDGYQIDTITMISEAGQVVTMTRSLLDLDKFIDHKEWVVMSGPELFQTIRNNQLADTSRIIDAYLAYQTKVHQGYVELIPVWVVELSDRTKLYVNARLPQEGGKPNGLE
ncbi:YycH family regulatory protein [Brevibacillus sp. H7]|uniref:YycH family regulatory protein n=1 Tax=Brevibacillus sp. H7 TaxID=3349138 RepID=UPI003821F0BF